MKYITLIIGLLVVGCGKDKQPTSEQPVSRNETVVEDNKPIRSNSGLEGWGQEGVKINIQSIPQDNAVNEKVIEKQVELKLRREGITVNESVGSGYSLVIIIRHIYITDAQTKEKGIFGHSIVVLPRRHVIYEANGKTFIHRMATQWVYSGIAPAGELGESINKYMDKFLLDYLKANNKKTGPNYIQRPPKRITENSLEDDIAGTYVNGKTKLVFYKDGSVEQFYKGASRKWKWKVTSVENKEIVAFASYFKRMPDGNLLDVGLDLGKGRREVYPKEEQKVYRKIK